MTITATEAPLSLNQQFTNTRNAQIRAAYEGRARAEAANAARAKDWDARVKDGRLIPLGGGQFRVNETDSWDNGEILVLRQTAVGPLILPQHGLDESKGSVALYSREPAWHLLGNIVPGGVTDIDQVLRLGGIDFTVGVKPVQFSPDGGTTYMTMPDKFVTYREDTNAGLGVVGKIYTPFQNRMSFEFLQDLVVKYDVVWESAGALREGRSTFVCMRLPEDVVIDADGVNDVIRPYVVALNSHDGLTKFRCIVTPWRVECANTERFALRDAHASWGVAHTTNGPERLAEARKTLKLSVKYFEEFAREEEALAQTELAIDEFHAVIKEIWEVPAADAKDNERKAYSDRAARLHHMYDEQAKTLGRTAYAAERVFTEWTDWKRPVRPIRSLRNDVLATRATFAMEGLEDTTKNKVHRQLMLRVRR